MKKIIFTLLVLTLVLTAVACGKKSKSSTEDASSAVSAASELIESTVSVTENDLFPQTGTTSEYTITESDAKELFEMQEEEDTDSKDDGSSKTDEKDDASSGSDSKDETSSKKTESDKETTSSTSSSATSSKTEGNSKYDADSDGWTDGWN